VTWICSN